MCITVYIHSSFRVYYSVDYLLWILNYSIRSSEEKQEAGILSFGIFG